MIIERRKGVPRHIKNEFSFKNNKYCLLIPVINEGDRILKELTRAFNIGVSDIVDIVICDGGSTDNSLNHSTLKDLNVNTLLIKQDGGKQGAQLRMGIFWALEKGYEGVITIDGNNKDSIEDISKFIEKLDEGYDYVQGSRFVKGGKAINTPIIRLVGLRLIHAPISSIASGFHFTDTTNAYRAYSKKYLCDKRVQPLRDIFDGYELLAYLCIRAPQLKMKVIEIPVARIYPKNEVTPTKIKGFKGNSDLLKILFKAATNKYNP